VVKLKKRGSSGFGVGKPGELKAPEGLQTAFKCWVLEKSLLGRSRILFIFISLFSWIINPPEAIQLNASSRYLILTYKKVGRTKKDKSKRWNGRFLIFL
jgi:hypothetical protein